jgi:hypothetical protein
MLFTEVIFSAVAVAGTTALIIGVHYCRKMERMCREVVERQDWEFEVQDTRITYWHGGNEFVVYTTRGRKPETVVSSIRLLCDRVPTVTWTEQVMSVDIGTVEYPKALKLAMPNGMFKATRTQILKECGIGRRSVPILLNYYDGNIHVM